MKKNMGIADRVIRLLLVMVFIVLYIQGTITGVIAWSLLAVSVIFLLTSLAGACPLYTFLGISSCKAKAKAKA